MLCKVFDKTIYINVPCLGSGYSPGDQPTNTTMYSSWKEPEQLENFQPKISGSSTNLRENFSDNEDGVRYFDNQLDKRKSSREFGYELKEDKGGRETEEEALERPQFQVTFEKPVGQSLGRNNYKHARRASDGSMFASNLSGRVVRNFGVLTEETTSQVSTNHSNTEPLSTTPLSRNRRVSVDYLRPPIANQRRVKVSVVLPQPRNKENSSLRQIKSNENLSSISCDSEDTSWRELVAKSKGFRPSRSEETLIDRRANDFLTVPHTAKAPGRILSVDCKDGTNRRSSDSSYLDQAKTTVVAIPISSEFESERSSTVLKESLSDGEGVKRCELEANDAGKKTRRYSVTALRNSIAQPSDQSKVSGYSTHGTLEYARQLLGKLQAEGKNKSKKERLDELSKALKWILEELNRIEVPDSDLVSLFISLRAKIVNLKAEVKAEESDVSSDDLKRMKRMSQMLTTTANKPHNVYSRRFSWC